MIKFIGLLLVTVIALLVFLFFSSQSMPDWHSSEHSQSDRVVEQLSEDIQKHGTSKFLGQKFAQVMSGHLTLSEAEFNALVLASLKSSKDGRRLISVSDGIKASLSSNGIELGAVIDLQKAANADRKAKAAIEKLRDALPFLGKSKVFLAVQGKPIAKNGELAFSEDISVRIGSIPLSNSLLRQLGVPVHKVSTETLPIKLMRIESVQTKDGEIVLGVLPRF